MNNNLEYRAGISSRSWGSPQPVCLSRPRQWPVRKHARVCGKDSRDHHHPRRFLYPPTQVLEEKGYYSWPGSDFDAEGRQKQYMSRIREMEKTLGIRIAMDEKPLDTVSEVDEFIARTKRANPHGLLLIPLKKSPHWDHVVHIVEQTKIPTVILATLGVLQGSHVRQVIDRPGVYMINSPDNLDAVESGLRMVRTGVRLRNARIINIDGNEVVETTVPFVGTTVRRFRTSDSMICLRRPRWTTR